MKSSRIPVSTPQQGLQSPFAALDIAGLPAAPVEPVPPARPLRRGRVVLRREKAHRGGKTVVIISDFDPRILDSEIAEIARKARQHCGCGGTVHEREIELQGDQPAKVRAFFEGEGFTVAGV
jgi:translation initiation factor 1